MSEAVWDESAGMNGGFETVESGLPVNWLLYTPATIPTGDYDLVLDTTDVKEGRQSVKFVVRACAPTGGWHSPGLSGEYDAVAGDTYRVRFWVKNDGAEFQVRVGGVNAFEGHYETVVRSGEAIDDWRLIEHEYTVPPQFDRMSFELNVLQPGTFWVDDVSITRLSV